MKKCNSRLVFSFLLGSAALFSATSQASVIYCFETFYGVADDGYSYLSGYKWYGTYCNEGGSPMAFKCADEGHANLSDPSYCINISNGPGWCSGDVLLPADCEVYEPKLPANLKK